MDFDEIVETSDAEELEEIERKELEIRKQRARSTSERLTPPPRKKAKYFHTTDIEEESSVLSPRVEDSTRTNSPQRSQSSSTMFTRNTSPGPLFTSRSPTRSPGQAYSIQSLPKTEEDEDISLEFVSQPPELSQDPLLLHSPTRLLPVSRISSPLASPSNTTPLSIPQPTTTTPPHSPSRKRDDLFSSPLQFPDSPLHTQSQEVHAESAQGKNLESDLVMFTPTNEPSQLFHFSSRAPSIDSSQDLFTSGNVSPERRHSPALSQTSEDGGSLLPSVTVAPSVPHPQDDASIALVNELQQELNEGGRYSFRKRTVTQKMPFTTEDIRYKRQLKAIPEAIVKNKALQRHHHHHHPEDRYEEDGETQQDSFVDDGGNPEDDPWEHMEEPRKRRRTDEHRNRTDEVDVTRYPEILQGLPDTDEEEDKEMDAVTREARRLIKRKAREQKAREREERERKAREENLKAKRFPVSKRLRLSPKPKSPVVHVHNGDDNKNDEGSGHGSPATTRTPGARQPSHLPSTPVSAAMRDYFAQNDDFYIDNNEYPYNNEPQEDHSGWDRNSPVNDHNPTPPSPTGPDSYETPLQVDVDEGEPLHIDNDEPDQSQPSRTDAEIELDLEPKKARALRKMYPEFMIRGMFNGGGGSKTPKPQRPHQKEKDSEDEGPPQVGHTRKQISAHPKDIKDIRGDSESELELSNSGSDSSTDSSSSDDDDDDDRRYSVPSSSGAQSTPSDHQHRVVKIEKREVIDLTGYHSDEEGAWPSRRLYQHQRRGTSAPRLRDSSMIDYMLAKSSRLESKRSGRAKFTTTSGGKQPKFKNDVMTAQGRKYGREIQTTLHFYSNGASTSHRRRKSGKQKISSQYDFDDLSDQDTEHQAQDQRLSDVPVDSFQRRKLDKKKKYKEKKKKEKYIGVHVFSGGAQKIISGRRHLRLNASITDLEQFQKILLPSSQTASNQIDWSREYAPPLIEKRLKRRDTPGNTSNNHVSDDELTSKARPTISSHFNIPILLPGKSFAPSTHIKKGWLYQLTTPDPDAPQPFISSSTIFGFEVGPDMGVEQLCALLPNVFEALLEYATSLPDPDFVPMRTQWLLLMRGLSQLTSFYLKNSGIEEASNLRNAIQREVLQLVEQIEQTSMNFIDTPILTVCWFMVDMSTRIRYHSLPPSMPEIIDKPLKYSSALLMRLLLKVGVNKTIQVLLDDADLDGTSPALYSLELWVSLIHVLGIATNADAEVKPQKHPFWLLLKDALTDRVTELNTRTPLETSEDVWFTILSVSTISQFSVHGMTLSHFHLPSDWSIVSFAFKRMHLGKVPQHSEHAKLFDRYVSLIVDRCYDLHERYKWKLDDLDTYSTFNELAEIFRARKFANLLHEKSEYSRFFQKADWDLLLSREMKDSAFTVFLKLVVQAALSDSLHVAGKPSPRVRKLLSIVIPMGSLPFTEDNKPQGNDLTKFYNRITALVVAGDLDRTSIDERIQKARGYIDFAKADRMSRIAVIRAIRNWGIMLVDRRMSLRPISPWIEELANALVAEIKQLPGVEPGKQDDKQQVPKPLIEMVACLLWSVRNISNACAKHTRYPYIYFLESLRPLLVQGTFDFQYPRIAEEYLLLIESFFGARSAALPPPPRPPLPALPSADEESQESQDFGIEDDFANMDWSGLDLPHLAPSAPSKTKGDDDDDGSFLASMRNLTSIRWAVFRALKPYLSRSKGYEIAVLEHCKSWLHSWFGFASVDGQESTWNLFLSKVDEELQKCRDQHWVRNVELCVMLNVLKYSPMQYLHYRERAFGSLLNALVSANNILSDTETHNMFEREYVSWIFTIDGLRHPLLSDMSIGLPARNETSGDYEFGSDEFLALRIPLLRGIFKNLEKQITLQLRGPSRPEVLLLDTDRYVALCNNMFSGVRNNLLRLEKPSDKYTEYLDFSKQTVDALQGNRELCERMKFWADWRP